MKHEDERASTVRRVDHIKQRQAESAIEALRASNRKLDSEGRQTLALLQLEKESDLKLAEDLLGFNTGVSSIPETGMSSPGASKLDTYKIFSPETEEELSQLLDFLVPVIRRNFRSPHYPEFCRDLFTRLAHDLPSNEVKKIGSSLVTLSAKKA
ncbi:eukaryotic translation initiation factor 3 subunit J [Aspergillus novoparasiticus]|uniref:Eukaryotic translation initiation factor 3 30 kDa subunit n=1 Tax=Aspergillus novoparasiticus TaxID=986946 RepID=A0A5N6EWH9_9EURO|nr:eukaryotic translation initiation factor 3 subunit J [Aspergillus novoparasiticus]